MPDRFERDPSFGMLPIVDQPIPRATPEEFGAAITERRIRMAQLFMNHQTAIRNPDEAVLLYNYAYEVLTGQGLDDEAEAGSTAVADGLRSVLLYRAPSSEDGSTLPNMVAVVNDFIPSNPLGTMDRDTYGLLSARFVVDHRNRLTHKLGMAVALKDESQINLIPDAPESDLIASAGEKLASILDVIQHDGNRSYHIYLQRHLRPPSKRTQEEKAFIKMMRAEYPTYALTQLDQLLDELDQHVPEVRES